MRRALIPLAAILPLVASASAAFPAQNSNVSPAGEIEPGTTQTYAEELGSVASTHIILMIDKSGSTQLGDDLDTQLAGYASALERSKVSDALSRIHADISVIAWSGADEQFLFIDRASITGESSARDLAAKIRALPIAAGGLTDLASAVGFAIGHLDRVATRGQCSVIIASTDQLDGGGYFIADAQEQIFHAHHVRAIAIERNIIIHGFGLENPSVAKYLRDNVATPQGEVAFISSDASFADGAARLLSGDICRFLIADSSFVHPYI